MQIWNVESKVNLPKPFSSHYDESIVGPRMPVCDISRKYSSVPIAVKALVIFLLTANQRLGILPSAMSFTSSLFFLLFFRLRCGISYHGQVSIGNFPSSASKPSSSPCLPLALGHILVVVSVLWRPFLPTLTQFLPTHKTQEEVLLFSSKLSTTALY